MGNLADQLQKDGKRVVYAFEEAIGHMCFNPPLDKDGVSAAVKIAELVVHLEQNEGGKPLSRKLDELFLRYGYHKATTNYYLSHDPEVTRRIFERIRSYEDGKPNTVSFISFVLKSLLY
jgi:phosphomannomutase